MIPCGGCHGAIDVDDPDVVYAVELKETLTFLGSEYVEGACVYFHEECFPWDSPGYREKPRPKVSGVELPEQALWEQRASEAQDALDQPPVSAVTFEPGSALSVGGHAE
jgi:hypothetical protein